VIWGARIQDEYKGKVRVMAIMTGVQSAQVLGPSTQKQADKSRAAVDSDDLGDSRSRAAETNRTAGNAAVSGGTEQERGSRTAAASRPRRATGSTSFGKRPAAIDRRHGFASAFDSFRRVHSSVHPPGSTRLPDGART